MNADYIHAKLQAFNPTIRYKAAPVAGWFYAGNCTDEKSAEWNWAPPNDYPHWIENEIGGTGHDNSSDVLYQSYLNTNCEQNENISWHCGTAHVSYKYIETPLLILENIYDSQQIETEMQLPSNVSNETKEYVSYFGYNMLLSIANQVQSPNGVFLASCFDHCGGIGYGNYAGSTASSTQIDGYNVTQVLGDWFWDRNEMPHILIDTCDSDLPCNPTCDSYGQ